MPPRKKTPLNKLMEGEYPTKTYARDGDGFIQEIPSTARIPPSERPVPSIKGTLLSEFLLPTFDSLNIKGKSGIDALILLARMGAHRYDSLRKFCIAWEDLHQPNLFAELYPELEFTEPTLEQTCDLAKVDHSDFIGDISKMVYHYGGEMTKWKMQIAAGDIVEAAINVATTEGAKGFADRQMLLKATGHIAEGPGTVVNVNNQAITNNVVGLPKWEDSDRLLQKTLLAPKALPQQSVVEAEIIEEKGGDAKCTIPDSVFVTNVNSNEK